MVARNAWWTDERPGLKSNVGVTTDNLGGNVIQDINGDVIMTDLRVMREVAQAETIAWKISIKTMKTDDIRDLTETRSDSLNLLASHLLREQPNLQSVSYGHNNGAAHITTKEREYRAYKNQIYFGLIKKD